VAAGDADGDGRAAVIVGAGQWAGPHVKVFDGATGAEVRSFFAYSPGFSGGVNVAAGDFDGDGRAEIVTGAATTAPHVKVFDGASLAELQSFFALPPGGGTGASVAAADLDGDGRADLVAGAAAGPPLVQVFAGPGPAIRLSTLAFGPPFGGGVSVGAAPAAVPFSPPDTTGPTVVSVTPEQPSGATVSSVLVRFSEPIDPATFTAADVALSQSVFANPNQFFTVTPVSPAVFRVTLGPAAAPTQLAVSATAAIAPYTLTVDAAGVTDAAGNAGTGTGAGTWATFNHALRNLFVRRSPANANNTVVTLTTGTFPGALTPPAFDAGRAYNVEADLTGDGVPDVTYSATFGAPDVSGLQDVTLSRSAGGNAVVVAQGKTGTDIPVAGGGTFRAALQDDPFFFDQAAYDNRVDDGVGTFPRPVGQAKDLYGPNGNTLAITLEVPSLAAFPTPASNPNNLIGFWGEAEIGGVQVDRTARPLTDDLFIPPVPRNNPATPDRRVEFRLASPAQDRVAFKNDMIAVLTDPAGLYKRSANDANFLADAWLPDFVMFQLGNPGGFGTLVGPGPGLFTGPFAGGEILANGRQFRDDVLDIQLNLFTNGAIPSDNVGDDNGLKITDGSVDPVSQQTRSIGFPYIGLPNGGPNL
jgi:hypothetical protein